MAIFPELEINLQRRDKEAFLVGLRFLPVNDEKISIHNGVSLFRPPALEKIAAEVDPADYGTKLTAALFPPLDDKKDDGEPNQILPLFHDYRKRGESGGGLRVRLVAPPDLQDDLRWETLFDPEKPGEPLFCGGGIHFSRYLSGPSAKPLRSRAKGDLRALIFIANPAVESLANVNVAEELDRAQKAFAKAEVRVTVDEHASGGTATLANLCAKLRNNYDILYLVCHGALVKGEPRLWLESENPDPLKYAPIRASELIAEIGKLDHPPRLVVFASCQSAGGTSRDKGALSAIGPRLVSEAGVAAVVAMQGDITMKTVETFMPTLFTEMLRDGKIDVAMTVARGEARLLKRSDYWMPALFTGLQSCALWYEPGFAGQTFSAATDEKAFWTTLCGSIQSGACVPIIGPDLAEHIYGSTRSLAATLAEVNGFPLSRQDQSDLAKVTQFMCTRDQIGPTRKKVRDQLSEQFVKNATALVPPGTPPAKLMAEVTKSLVNTDGDPLRITASLNAKVYVTASTDVLFEDVLEAIPLPDGSPRKPRSIVMQWRDERRLEKVEGDRAIFKPKTQTQTEQFLGDPTEVEPYLYYIFGQRASKPVEIEDTWVLTEDDVFDYLIQTSKYDLMPQVVADALGSNSILFLGFPLDDWKFRVLFRMILAIEGNSRLGKLSHVGVQVDPDQTTLADAQRAKKYLEKYFAKPFVMRENMAKPSISIYWGSSADFLRQLNQELKNAPPPPLEF